MGFRLREIEAESKFCRRLTLESIARAVPQAEVEAVLQTSALPETRERKLNLLVTMWVVLALHLYSHLSIGHVLQKVSAGLRYIWPQPDIPLPQDSALCYRRYQLGARPVVALFHRVCRPLAQPHTRGAFLFGLRLMAIDSTIEDVPDTPENEAAFGRHHSARGAAAYPQVRGVYLCECGAHAIVDAGFWPCHTGEDKGAKRLLRSVTAGGLVMWDQGLHSYDLTWNVQQRGAYSLSRVPSNVKLTPLRPLSDGSSLAYLQPRDRKRRAQGGRLLVRVIRYTLTDPALPGYGEVHRLITTLLDAERYPALELACAYHERWEVEVVIDEIDTHQRLLARTLRSLKPVGVIQELYAVLIAHYAVRYLMHEAALLADLDPDRLSFVHALEVLRDAIPQFQQTTPEQLPELYRRLLGDIAAVRLPERRPRSNPRVVKRKMSKFHLKRPEHAKWPQPTLPFHQAIALI